MLDAVPAASSTALGEGAAGRGDRRSGRPTPAPLPTADHPRWLALVPDRRARPTGAGGRGRRPTPRRPGSSRSTGPLPPGRGRQPGARGQHHRRLGGLRRRRSPSSGPTATTALNTQRGLRVRQLHRTAARSPSPSRSSSWSARSTSSCRRTSPAAVNYACVRVRDLRAGHPAGGQRARDAQRRRHAARWPRSGRSCRPSASRSRTCRWPSCATGSPSSSSGSSTSCRADTAPRRRTEHRGHRRGGPRRTAATAPTTSDPTRTRRRHLDGGRRHRSSGTSEPAQSSAAEPTARRRRRRRPRNRHPRRPRRAVQRTPTTSRPAPPADPDPERARARARENGRSRRRPLEAPCPSRLAAAPLRNPDLLGIYCNDHLAAATGGIELVSRMLGRHRGTSHEAHARGAARRAARGAERRCAPPWRRSASRSASTSRSASWVGEKVARAQAQRAPAVPVAAQRPGRVRVHRHGGARQARRLRDPARASRPSTPGWTPPLLDRLIAQADKQHDWLADVRREVAAARLRRATPGRRARPRAADPARAGARRHGGRTGSCATTTTAARPHRPGPGTSPSAASSR